MGVVALGLQDAQLWHVALRRLLLLAGASPAARVVRDAIPVVVFPDLGNFVETPQPAPSWALQHGRVPPCQR
eukprot:4940126-Heterocapsa_arctica.AAC.1